MKNTVIEPFKLDFDEKEIQKIIAGKRYSTVLQNLNDDTQLVEYIISLLTRNIGKTPRIVTITGGPASGKSTLRVDLLAALVKKGYRVDYVSTDDFGMFTDRVERDKKIAEGLDPYDAKDWKYLRKILTAVRQGKSIKAPVYDEKTGTAAGVGEENFPHVILSHLNFFFIEGDFQPLRNADLRIYFHVPTQIRRENRISRDLAKRNGKNPEEIKKSFDYRLISQYYPHTLPHAEKADILIVTNAEKEPITHPYAYRYYYTLLKKNV